MASPLTLYLFTTIAADWGISMRIWLIGSGCAESSIKSEIGNICYTSVCTCVCVCVCVCVVMVVMVVKLLLERFEFRGKEEEGVQRSK